MRVLAAVLLVSLCASVARADGPFAMRPYLMSPRPDGITLVVHLTRPAPAAVILVRPDGTEQRFQSTAQIHHELRVDGLPPATRVGYRIEVDGQVASRGAFSTAPAAGQGPVRFLVYGDCRGDLAMHQRVVARMRTEAADFVLHTGDFVADGRNPADWRELFAGFGDLFEDTPLLPVIGNHELTGEEGLRAYGAFFDVPEHVPGADERWWSAIYGNVRLFALDTESSFAPGSPQRAWLERALDQEEPEGIVRIATMHRGPFSSGYHGPNEEALADGLPRLLEQGGVQLILSGHDHIYERGRAGRLKYVVSGGGGAPLYPQNRGLPTTLAFVPENHFLRVEVDGGRVTIEAVRPGGERIEKCAFAGGAPWRCESARGEAGPVAAGTPMWAHWAGWSLPLVFGVGFVGAGGLVWRRRARRPA